MSKLLLGKLTLQDMAMSDSRLLEALLSLSPVKACFHFSTMSVLYLMKCASWISATLTLDKDSITITTVILLENETGLACTH